MNCKLISILSGAIGLLFFSNSQCIQAVDSSNAITDNNPTIDIQAINCSNSLTSSGYWVKEFSVGSQFSLSTSDGGLITGGNRNSYVTTIYKFNEHGVILWSWDINTNEDITHNLNYIIETNDGGYVFTGGTHSPITETDIFIIKLNSSGIIEWQKSISSYSQTATRELINNSNLDGGYLLSGNTNYYGDGDYYAVLQSSTKMEKLSGKKCIHLANL